MEGTRIINRDYEQETLRKLLEKGGSHLVLLTGRRRIGKTYLLAGMWPREQSFLYTASKTTGAINRYQLVRELARWSGEALYPEDYPTWRSLFTQLLTVRAPEPLVIILDEFQYLAEEEGGIGALASELNAVWERRRDARPLLLILSGSAVGTMEALAAGGAPLYGRFDWQRRLGPFGYHHAAEMAPFKSLRDRALAYGIFGGTPRYLAAIDATSETLAENVARLLLSPTGEVRLLTETALDQEDGLRDVGKYKAIVRAVAAGSTARNDIAQRTGLANDTGLRTKLDTLIELGYLEVRQNFEASSNETLRFSIADPAFRFKGRFTDPLSSMLERYPAIEVWSEMVAPDIDAYMGLEFERIAAQAYDRLCIQKGWPMAMGWGRWEGVDRERKPAEIDLLTRLQGGRMLSGSVKWNASPVGARLHYQHLALLRRLSEAGKSWAHDALREDACLLYVSASGFDASFLEAVEGASQNVMLLDLHAMYGQLPAEG